MSFYDDASLILIPSGYKTSKLYSAKPTDGSGDLTFTRTGSTATRVNSAGLIEECRTNQILRSEEFDNASWQKYQTTVSANSVNSPIGTLTAETLTDNASNDIHCVLQSYTFAAVPTTISVYAKANTLSHCVISGNDGVTSFNSGTFNLSNGTVSGSGTIVSVGNGWYRCSFSFTPAAGSGLVCNFTSNGSTITYAGTSKSIYIWGAQLEVGDIATAYIPTTSAAVTVGPVANLPRLDYTGGGCPKLLMEPTRTNLALYSEALNNASWAKSNVTVSANSTASPDGYISADTVILSAGTTQKYIGISNTLNGTYTYSFYLKYLSHQFVQVFVGSDSAVYCNFDLQNKTLSATGCTAIISDAGNGWLRCSLTFTSTTGIGIYFLGANSLSSTRFSTTSSTGSFYVWGAQLEAGSYATSYIPTWNASVTRNADGSSTTGLSSLIGQTEGTIIADVNISHIIGNEAISSINSGNYSNNVTFQRIGNAIQFVRESATQSGPSSVISSPISAGRFKMAIAYKSGNTSFFLNGLQIGSTQTETFANGTLGNFRVGADAIGSIPISDTFNQLLLFKTRLSNADCITLTTL